MKAVMPLSEESTCPGFVRLASGWMLACELEQYHQPRSHACALATEAGSTVIMTWHVELATIEELRSRPDDASRPPDVSDEEFLRAQAEADRSLGLVKSTSDARCPGYTASKWSPGTAEPEDDCCVNCGQPRATHDDARNTDEKISSKLS